MQATLSSLGQFTWELHWKMAVPWELLPGDLRFTFQCRPSCCLARILASARLVALVPSTVMYLELMTATSFVAGGNSAARGRLIG